MVNPGLKNSGAIEILNTEWEKKRILSFVLNADRGQGWGSGLAGQKMRNRLSWSSKKSEKLFQIKSNIALRLLLKTMWVIFFFCWERHPHYLTTVFVKFFKIFVWAIVSTLLLLALNALGIFPLDISFFVAFFSNIFLFLFGCFFADFSTLKKANF